MGVLPGSCPLPTTWHGALLGTACNNQLRSLKGRELDFGLGVLSGGGSDFFLLVWVEKCRPHTTELQSETMCPLSLRFSGKGSCPFSPFLFLEALNEGADHKILSVYLCLTCLAFPSAPARPLAPSVPPRTSQMMLSSLLGTTLSCTTQSCPWGGALSSSKWELGTPSPRSLQTA